MLPMGGVVSVSERLTVLFRESKQIPRLLLLDHSTVDNNYDIVSRTLEFAIHTFSITTIIEMFNSGIQSID